MHNAKLINVYLYSKTEMAWFPHSPVISLIAEYPTSYQVRWPQGFYVYPLTNVEVLIMEPKAFVAMWCVKKKGETKSYCSSIFKYTEGKRFLCNSHICLDSQHDGLRYEESLRYHTASDFYIGILALVAGQSGAASWQSLLWAWAGWKEF